MAHYRLKDPVRKFILLAAAVCFSGSALADKPASAGGGKHGKKDGHQGEQQKEQHDNYQDNAGSFRFNDDSRKAIGSYYGEQARSGKCPPGLAKKNNGCMPPGQAKKWARGRPLPPDLRYNDLPYDLLRRLPPPPPQHRYVQVAGDVLMIAVGSSMVIDAVEDILR
jgi:Ni/Co efflux regulator RcnB